MRVMVLDGQGGGIGATLIKGLRASLGLDLEILALGTNSIATSRMMKAGANRGGSGENAIVRTSHGVDVIIGPVSILMANAMMGELTPKMATAVSSSPARKILASPYPGKRQNRGHFQGASASPGKPGGEYGRRDRTGDG